MPRITLPPTPQPSTEIAGKPAAQPGNLDTSFALPPAALSAGRSSTANSSAASNASDSSYRPLSPPSPLQTTGPSKTPTSATRKRSSNPQIVKSVITNDDYNLPPPPTRSRKIIQMKPRTASADESSRPATQASLATSAPGAAGVSKASTNSKSGSATGSKRKQTGGQTTAAGRKIARKTAHSLIERRRRSKMNEEFATLRDMVPACRGQEMHKLAILQESIGYMRYLEECITDLKTSRQERKHAEQTSPSSIPPCSRQQQQAQPQQQHEGLDIDDEDDEIDDESDSDASMADAQEIGAEAPNFPQQNQPQQPLHHSFITTVSPILHPQTATPSATASATTSPALPPSDPRQYSMTSVTTSNSHHSYKGHTTISPTIFPSDAANIRHHSLASSSATSPVIGPRGAAFQPQQPLPPFSSHSALTSPALQPQPDLSSGSGRDVDGLRGRSKGDHEDQEATAALLMLGNDRRSWSGAKDGGTTSAVTPRAEKGRSMSVKDLLSN